MLLSELNELKIVYDTADEDHQGLCPVLSSSIPTNLFDNPTSGVANEYAIRLAIEEERSNIGILSGYNYETSGETYKQGDIYSYTTADTSANTLFFRSLEFNGPMYPMSAGPYDIEESPTVYLNTTQKGGPSGVVEVENFTMNGGIEQEVTKITFNDLSGKYGPLSGIPIFKVGNNQGVVIGKILVRCDSDFTFGHTSVIGGLSGDNGCLVVEGESGGIVGEQYNQYSIGTDVLSAGFVTQFQTEAAGTLSNISYGEYLLDRVEYFNSGEKYALSAVMCDRLGSSTATANWGISCDINQSLPSPYNYNRGFKFQSNGQLANNTFTETDIITSVPVDIGRAGVDIRFGIYIETMPTSDFTIDIQGENGSFVIDDVIPLRIVSSNLQYMSQVDDLSGGWDDQWNTISAVSEDVYYDIEIFNIVKYSTGYAFTIAINGETIGDFDECEAGSALDITSVEKMVFKRSNISTGGITYLDYLEIFDHVAYYESTPSQDTQLRALPGLRAGDEIKLFKLTSYEELKGSMTIIVFYDSFNIEQNTGNKIVYIGGSGSSYSIAHQSYEIFNYENSTFSSLRGNVNYQRANYFAGTADGGLMYIMGGTTIYSDTDDNYVNNKTIERMDSSNYASRTIPASLPTHAYRGSSISTSEYLYAFGGYTDYSSVAGTDKIQRLIYATETTEDTGVDFSINISDSSAVINWPAESHAYVIGGREVSAPIDDNSFVSDIRDIDISTATPSISDLGVSLEYGSEGHFSVWDGTKIWIIGGAKGEEDFGDITKRIMLNTTRIVNPTNSTLELLATKIIKSKGFGAANTTIDRSITYCAGGGNITPGTASSVDLYYAESNIDIINFVNDTDCVKCNSSLNKSRLGFKGLSI